MLAHGIHWQKMSCELVPTARLSWKKKKCMQFINGSSMHLKTCTEIQLLKLLLSMKLVLIALECLARPY